MSMLCVDGGEEEWHFRGSLAGAFLVFDEGEADEGVAVVAEADAGADGGFGVDEEFLGEVERAHGAELFGDFGPDEHGGLGHFDVPAELVERSEEHTSELQSR